MLKIQKSLIEAQLQMKADKINILNIDISISNIDDLLQRSSLLIDNNQKFYICTVNAFLAVRANEDKWLLTILNKADIVVPDGMPIVWYSRFLKKTLPGRISGFEFFYNFSKIANTKKYSYFFLGGENEKILDMIKQKLNREFSNIEVKGILSPPFMEEFPDEFDNQMVKTINKYRPDVLWVGLSAPKQEKWIYKNIKRLDIKMAFGIGAAFNFYAGSVKRAPVWMQKAGLEWLFRMFAEPGRLFKKYLVNNMKFLMLVSSDIFKRTFCKNN